MEAREGRAALVADVSSALHPAVGTAGDQDWQIDVIVEVRVAHSAAVHVHRMVKQRAFAIGSVPQFVDHVGAQ